MSAKIPESHVDLFHKKAFGSFTTLMPDGSPQTTPVWVDLVDDKVLVNSALGRQKDKNLRRDPRASFYVTTPDLGAYLVGEGEAELTNGRNGTIRFSHDAPPANQRVNQSAAVNGR